MKNVVLKKLKVKNLLSIGDDWVEINYNPGINSVIGFNYDKKSYNGSGKSALLVDALSFALFGTTVRDTTKDLISNRFTKKGTKAILAFDVIANGEKSEYILMRSIDPTKIQLVKNGTENITKSSIPKTTEYICKLIGISPDIFTNTVVMTLNDTIPFMAQKKVDKRKFIEGILRLEVFGNMLLLARQEFNDLKKEQDTEFARLDELQKSLTVYIEQQKTFIDNKETKITELALRNKANQKEIDTLTPKLKQSVIDIKVVNGNISLLQAKETQCNIDSNSVNKLIGSYEQDLKRLDNELVELATRKDFCLKCKRPFTEKDHDEAQHETTELEKQKTELNQKLIEQKAELAKTTEILKKCKAGITKFQVQLSEKEMTDKENENILARIEQLHAWNKQLTSDIKRFETEKDHFGNLIEETKVREGSLVKKCDEIKTRLANLEIVKFIVSEEGVKSFIVKKILKVLNSKLTYYLKRFNANCILSFDEYFEERLIDDHGNDTTYHNFSAGEKKRIDLASLFAFQDIRKLQGDISTNVSIYDELFDSSLEKQGIDMALNILKERAEKYNESIFIISHKNVPELVSGELGEVIYLEKKDGSTRRVDQLTN